MSIDALARALALGRAPFESFTKPATTHILRELNHARQILDLASGTGDPALAIAAALPGASIIASDKVPELLRETTREAHTRGITNVRTVVADMQALPLTAASVDAVTSRLGIQFAQDARSVLREIRRVLKPDGITCHVVWGAPAQPLLREILHSECGKSTFEIGRPGPFQFSRAGSLAQALAEAGFADVEEHTHQSDWVWPGDARSFLQFMQQTAAEALVPGENPEAAIVRLKAFEQDRTLVFPVETHYARARKPAA